MVVQLTSGSDSGFSLIELLVVVAVTSILAVSATLVASRSGDAAGDAATAFRAEATTLRRLAMTTGADHAVRFRDDGWTRQISTAGGSWRDLPALNSVAAPMSARPDRIVFRSDGSLTQSVVRFGNDNEMVCRTSPAALPYCERS